VIVVVSRIPVVVTIDATVSVVVTIDATVPVAFPVTVNVVRRNHILVIEHNRTARRSGGIQRLRIQLK
jgi:hypothetical protein